jgi:hypothetical protein
LEVSNSHDLLEDQNLPILPNLPIGFPIPMKSYWKHKLHITVIVGLLKDWVSVNDEPSSKRRKNQEKIIV